MTAGQAYVEIVRGPGRGRRIELDRPVLVLGRAADADVRFDDGRISSVHARIERRGQGYELCDCSSNGTWLGERALEGGTARLLDGAEIVLAQTVWLRFHHAAVEAPAAALEATTPVAAVPAARPPDGGAPTRRRVRRSWQRLALGIWVLAWIVLLAVLSGGDQAPEQESAAPVVVLEALDLGTTPTGLAAAAVADVREQRDVARVVEAIRTAIGLERLGMTKEARAQWERFATGEGAFARFARAQVIRLQRP